MSFAFDYKLFPNTAKEELVHLKQIEINHARETGTLIYNRANACDYPIRQRDVNRFVSYINGKWLVPVETPASETKKYRIWRPGDKDEIVKECIACKMLDTPSRFVTFNSVVTLLQNYLGYEVESGRFMQDKQRHTYKLIISYDMDRRTYAPTAPEIELAEKMERSKEATLTL